MVFSHEHVRSFQQIPKGVFNCKTSLEIHWSTSFLYGLVPASLSTFVVLHCLPPLQFSYSNPLSAPHTSKLTPVSEPFACNYLFSLDLHMINSAQTPLLEVPLPWCPNLKRFLGHFLSCV